MPRPIATNTAVDRDGLPEFLRPRHHVMLMTTRADGSPQLSPATAGIDDDGRAVVASYPERAKSSNARRRPTGARPMILPVHGGVPGHCRAIAIWARELLLVG